MRTQHEHSAVDNCRDRLRRAGWSLGEFSHGTGWTVEVSRGLVRIQVTAPTQAQAWRLAFYRAAAWGRRG